MTEVAIFSKSEEYAELFLKVYNRLAEYDDVPHLDGIYHLFYKEWLIDVHNFLYANREAYKLTEKELENIESELETFGFKIPSYKQIHAYINLLQMCYQTDVGIFNEAVTNVW